jgi:hypothetical protein
MSEERKDERDPNEALEQMRAKQSLGEDLSPEEREFVDSERARVDPDTEQDSQNPQPQP